VLLQTGHTGFPGQGTLGDLAIFIQEIRRLHAFGRLSLRNTEAISIAHLYFRAGKLVHMVGNRGDVRTILADLRGWTHAVVRFDRGVTSRDATLNDEHERLLDETLAHLYQRGLLVLPGPPPVVESNLVASREAKQLITPLEWRVLTEAMRRISLAVARLVGQSEAIAVLQDILDDCSSAFPAFASLRIAPTGYLEIVDRSQLDRMSREELIEGFAALFATCQYFCAPIVGEREAHQLIIHALQDVGPALVNLGVFSVDNALLAGDDARTGWKRV
jgi:hypothetical protein